MVDGSDFDEFKALYGSSLVTGWAQLHGYPVGILAKARGVPFSEEAQKAAQFIQLGNQMPLPTTRCSSPEGSKTIASSSTRSTRKPLRRSSRTLVTSGLQFCRRPRSGRVVEPCWCCTTWLLLDAPSRSISTWRS